ncbi:hypothetical protein AC1031_014142 [Aphanomyces cochlioides]|nr:hypothetical protein AC1031_014142 [Aphanomyces cochlioides]
MSFNWNLSQNSLDMIPPEVAHRPNLRVLDVSRNFIGAMTNLNLSSLILLNLDNNPFRTFQNAQFSKRLTSLSATFVRLERFETTNETYQVLSELYKQGNLRLATDYTSAGRNQCDLAHGRLTSLGSNITICLLPSNETENVSKEPVSPNKESNYTPWILSVLVTIIIFVAAVVIHRREFLL